MKQICTFDELLSSLSLSCTLTQLITFFLWAGTPALVVLDIFPAVVAPAAAAATAAAAAAAAACVWVELLCTDFLLPPEQHSSSLSDIVMTETAGEGVSLIVIVCCLPWWWWWWWWWWIVWVWWSCELTWKCYIYKCLSFYKRMFIEMFSNAKRFQFYILLLVCTVNLIINKIIGKYKLRSINQNVYSINTRQVK